MNLSTGAPSLAEVAAFLAVAVILSLALLALFLLPRGGESLTREEPVFRLGFRRYRRARRDVAAAHLLMRLGQLWTPAGYAEPLLRYRAEFRQLIHEQPVPGLVWCLAKSRDRHIRRMAVWLLGRCGDSRAIDPVSLYRVDGDRRLRVTVARALQRLHARAELQAMAEEDLDPWIREFAARHAVRSFAQHLAGFVGRAVSKDSSTARLSGTSMKLVVLVEPNHGGKRPKSAEAIRRILERIREWVHGPRRIGNGHG